MSCIRRILSGIRPKIRLGWMFNLCKKNYNKIFYEMKNLKQQNLVSCRISGLSEGLDIRRPDYRKIHFWINGTFLSAEYLRIGNPSLGSFDPSKILA